MRLYPRSLVHVNILWINRYCKKCEGCTVGFYDKWNFPRCARVCMTLWTDLVLLSLIEINWTRIKLNYLKQQCKQRAGRKRAKEQVQTNRFDNNQFVLCWSIKLITNYVEYVFIENVIQFKGPLIVLVYLAPLWL